MTLDRIALDAIRHVEAAKALIRQIPLNTTPITVHWLDVARRHIHSTRKDLQRDGL